MSVHKLSKAQVKRLIRTIAADGARVYISTHARMRMRQRHVTQEIVVEVLRQGRLVGTPEPNLTRGSLEC